VRPDVFEEPEPLASRQEADMRTILLYPGERLALADGTVIEAAVRPSSPMFDAPRDRELSSMTSAIRAATEKVGGQAALARILDVKPPRSISG
jgi:hypothetical protein